MQLLPNPMDQHNVSIVQTPIELSPEARAEIAARIKRLDDMAEIEKGDSWWRDVESAYRNEMPPKQEGLTMVPYPFLQPRIDALTAQVCTVITKQTPYMLAQGVGSGEIFSRKQKLVHEAWARARFDIQARKASTIAGNLNKVIFRLTPKLDFSRPDSSGGQPAASRADCPGINIEVIHPKDFFMAPASIGGIEESVWCAHRFYQRVADIKKKIKDGAYYDVENVTGGDSPQDHDDTGAFARAGVNLNVSFPGDEANSVECRYGWIRLDLSEIENGLPEGERWYRAVWIVKTQTLLALRNAEASSPEYFDTGYIPEWSSFWPASSVGRNLLGLHNYQSNLAATLYTGAMMSAMPPAYGPALNVKDMKYAFGDYIPMDDMSGSATPWSPNITFNGQPVVIQMQNNERIGDIVGRTSQNMMGAAVQDSTATQQSIIAAGVAVGIEEYIANFSSCLARMAEYTAQIFKENYEQLMPYFKSADGTPIAAPEDLDAECIWQPNGTSPQSTPGARIRDAQMLLEIAGNLGPASGLSPYDITQCILTNSSLSGTTGLQVTKEQLAQQQMAQAAAATPGNVGTSPEVGTDASPGGMAIPPNMGDVVGGGPAMHVSQP